MPDTSDRIREPKDPGPDPTWGVLLAKWSQFAQAAVSLPKNEHGERWRSVVADIIGLQAVTFALRDLGELPADERALGLDRAAVLIRSHAKAIHAAWGAEPLPEQLLELIGDAQKARELAESLGREWIVIDERWVAPDLWPTARRMLDAGFQGDMYAPAPETILFKGEPAVFVRPGLPTHVDAEKEPQLRGLDADPDVTQPRQVYRKIDETSGEVSGDVVTPLLTALPAGRPLLLPVIAAGELMPELSAEQTDAWRHAQAKTIGQRTLPVEYAEPQ